MFGLYTHIKSYILTLFIICLLNNIDVSCVVHDNVNNHIIQSISDHSKYTRFSLKNGVDVLIVEDESNDMAAVSTDVNAGWWNETTEGLAHFVEHMLFLGSTRYKNEGSFSRFTGRYGGHSNAFTGASHTNYYFTVENDGIKEGISRFSQFFVSPLFSESGISREIKAVHAEFIKDINDDDTRVEQVVQDLMDETYPAHHFSVGSLETLGKYSTKDLQTKAIEFWKKHYTGPNLRVVVISKYSAHTIKPLIEATYGKIPISHINNKTNNNTNENIQPTPTYYNDISENIFPTHVKGSLVYVAGQSNNQVITLTFPIPPQTPNYADKSLKYLFELLQNEHKRSLASTLIRKGIISEMKTKRNFNTIGFDTFDIEYRLLKDNIAFQDIHYIISLTFQYIRLIELDGIQEWRWREQGWVEAFKFKFMEDSSVTDLASTLSYNMGIYEKLDIIQAKNVYRTFKPNIIHDLLNKLIPQNMIVLIRRHKHNSNIIFDRTEHYYGTKYHIERLSPNEIEYFNQIRQSEINQLNHFQLPVPNPYLPSSHLIELRKPDSSFKNFSNDSSLQVPYLIQNDPAVRIWYQLSHARNEPRVCIRCALWTRNIYSSPRSRVLATLYTHLVVHRWHSIEYLANMAGAKIELIAHPNALYLHIEGYGFDDAFLKLIENVREELSLPNVLERHFDVVKKSLINSYRDLAFNPISGHIELALEMILKQPHWHASQYLEVINEITLHDVLEWAHNTFQDMLAECLLFGNINEQEASTSIFALLNGFKFQKVSQSWSSSPHVMRVNNIVGHHNFTAPAAAVNEQNSATLIYIQAPSRRGGAAYRRFGRMGRGIVGSDGTYTADAQLLMIKIVESLMEKPLYHQLRTKQQLGYIVDSGAIEVNGVQGIYGMVVSPKYSAQILHKRIMEFFRNYLRDIVHHLSDDQFKELVEHIAGSSSDDSESSSSTTNDTSSSSSSSSSSSQSSISDLMTTYWSEILERTYNFVSSDKLTKSQYQITQELNKADFMQFYDDLVDAHFRNITGIVSIQIQGRRGEVIDDKQDYITHFFADQYQVGRSSLSISQVRAHPEEPAVIKRPVGVSQQARIMSGTSPSALSPHRVNNDDKNVKESSSISSNTKSSSSSSSQPNQFMKASSKISLNDFNELYGRRVALGEHSNIDMRIDVDSHEIGNKYAEKTNRESLIMHHMNHLFSSWDRRESHSDAQFDDGALIHSNNGAIHYTSTLGLGSKPRKDRPKPKPGPGEELIKLKESRQQREMKHLMPETPRIPKARGTPKKSPISTTHKKPVSFVEMLSKLNSNTVLSNDNNNNNNKTKTTNTIDTAALYSMKSNELAPTCAGATQPVFTSHLLTLNTLNQFKDSSCQFPHEAVNTHPLTKEALIKIINENIKDKQS